MLDVVDRRSCRYPQDKRAFAPAISLLIGLLCGMEGVALGQDTLLLKDEAHLVSRVVQLHYAMESNDFAAWYRISSPAGLIGQRLDFDEFKQVLGLEDTYGQLQGWGVREGKLRQICNCADYNYSQGPRVLRCALLVHFVFTNGETAEKLELWDSVSGEWYWSYTEAQAGCPA
jgi:hypothetical protein